MEKISFLQHSYTSSEWFGEYGTYQASTELGLDFIKKLEKLEHYAPPQKLPSNPKLAEDKKYPEAFIHAIVDGKHVFCRIKYLGKDRHSRTGRMGNFFAHSWIQQEGTLFPIAALLDETQTKWQSDITDEEEGVEAPVLPIEIEVDANDIEKYFNKVSVFLEENRYETHFKQLITHILAKRRVLIIDTPDHLLKWITALTIAFPAKLTQTLTFSSYQQMPLWCAYDVVGLTEDNHYNEKELEAAGFFLIRGGSAPTSMNESQLYVAMLQEGLKDFERYKALIQCELFESESSISQNLNYIATQYKAIKACQNGVSLETFENYVITYPQLKPTLENILKGVNIELYYNWAERTLNNNKFEFHTFKTYFDSLNTDKQSGYLDFFYEGYKQHYQTTIITPFSEWMRDNHQTAHVIIKEIQGQFITQFYAPNASSQDQANEDAKYNLVKNLNEQRFTELEKENPYYSYRQEINRAFDKLNDFDFNALKKCLDKFETGEHFENLFNKFFILEKYVTLILNVLARKKLADIKPQMDLIKSVFEKHARLSVPLLKAIIEVNEGNFSSIAQLTEDSEDIILVKIFKGTPRCDNLLKLRAEKRLTNELLKHNAKDKHIGLEVILKNELDKKSLIMFFITQNSKDGYFAYYNFRVLQLLQNNKIHFGELLTDKDFIEVFLREAGTYLETISQDSLKDEVKAVIRATCSQLKLKEQDYITVSQHDTDSSLFNEGDIRISLQKVKNEVQRERFIDYLYKRNFFKQDWTYSDWIRFMNTSELTPNVISKPIIDYFTNKLKALGQAEHSNEYKRVYYLLIDYILAILIKDSIVLMEILNNYKGEPIKFVMEQNMISNVLHRTFVRERGFSIVIKKETLTYIYVILDKHEKADRSGEFYAWLQS